MDETLTSHPTIDARTRDSASPVWDMSQERVFMEKMLNQRVNFLLLIFSITVAGAVNSKTDWALRIILFCGSLISLLLTSALNRNQEKFALILEDLKSDPSHPVSIIDARARKNGSRHRLVSIWIPRICCSMLVIGSIAAFSGLVSVERGTQPCINNHAQAR